jgi:long-chain acyl-CoA synthetase
MVKSAVPHLPPFRSLAEMFLYRVATTPDGVAFQYPQGPDWKALTWRETGERVRAIACGLRALGLDDEQRCAILSSTRLDWIMVDLGILCAGGATTTIYPSNTAEECAFILQDSAAVLAVAENQQQVDKLRQKRLDLPALKKVIVLDGPGDGAGRGDDGWVITFAELFERGRAYDAANPRAFEKIARAVAPTALATIIYTSGTTGRPKGVELAHDCWLYEAEAIDALGLLTADDVQYLWLPLSHVFGKVLEAAQVRIGFQSAVDGRVERMVDNLGKVRPTFVAAVPRIFEKVHNKMVTSMQEKGGAQLRIFRWAFSVGEAYSRCRREGGRPSLWLELQQKLADQLVFAKLRARFGGRLRFFISGSAPLSREIAEFFHAAGILIAEGYGLTETTAASFVNRPERFKLGSVGLPLPGTEVRLAKDDGEILIRSRGVMRGYHQLPEATREVLDAEGWLHTGDIGVIDQDGFLRITDRKKDLIKTSTGKYVAPAALEGKLKAASPYISQVLVHGNNRNYVTALVTLDPEAMRGWAQEHGLGKLAWQELIARDEVRALIQAAVSDVNRSLANYETIKSFAILANDFSQELGELTASLKVKRKVVEEHYKSLLDGFYSGSMASL